MEAEKVRNGNAERIVGSKEVVWEVFHELHNHGMSPRCEGLGN